MSPLVHRLPPLARAYAAVAAADLLGAAVARADGLAGLQRAVVSGTAINAPIPFLAGQLAVVALACRFRGRSGGTLAALLLVPVGAVSVLSGIGDGSYAADLNPAERSIQVAVVAATALTVLLAARAVFGARRRRPGQAALNSV